MNSVLILAEAKFRKQFPFKGKRWNKSFRSLIETGQDMGLNVILSNFNKVKVKSKVVDRAWTLSNSSKWKQLSNKKFNLVYYRGKNAQSNSIGPKLLRSSITMINHPELENICDDKLLTPVIFPEMMQKTFLINNHYDMLKVLKFINTKKVVLKPRFGSFGRNVIIIDKSKLRNGITKDTIIQEFIDSSRGYKPLSIKGVHDIRVITVNGKIDHCYTRIPAEGSFLANMAKGASKFYIEPENLPSSIQKSLKVVDEKLSSYNPRIYSADFMINENKEARLVELNSKPGTLFYENSKKVRERFHRNIFRAIKKAM